MSRQITDLDKYLKAGQLEFTPYSTVYLKDGIFNIPKSLNTLAEKNRQALDNGYDGMRGVGYVPYLKKRQWQAFIKYESEVNKAIDNMHTLVLCAFPLDKCNASEFIDIIGNHRYAFIVQRGETLSLKTKTAREMNRSLAIGRTTPLTPLMQRFAVSGLKGFSDPEIIELFLSMCPYHQQKHPLVQIINIFQNIRGLLAASPEELEQSGLDSRCIHYIRLFRDIPAKVLEDKMKEQLVYKSPQDIVKYLYYSMRDLKKEAFKAIYLDSRNQIILTSDLFKGTLDKININARDVVEFAVANNTKSLIFVHNHPSGDPTPSQADRQLTRDLVFVGAILQIRVLDHIIIGDNKYFSFAQEELIQEFETEFLNLKLTGTAAARRRLFKARLPFGTGIINLLAG